MCMQIYISWRLQTWRYTRRTIYIYMASELLRLQALAPPRRVGGGATATAPDLRRNSTLPLATMPSPKAEQDAYLEARAPYAKLQNPDQTNIRTTPHSRIHTAAPKTRTAYT